MRIDHDAKEKIYSGLIASLPVPVISDNLVKRNQLTGGEIGVEVRSIQNFIEHREKT